MTQDVVPHQPVPPFQPPNPTPRSHSDSTYLPSDREPGSSLPGLPDSSKQASAGNANTIHSESAQPSSSSIALFDQTQPVSSGGVLSGKKGMFVGLAVGLLLGMVVIPRFTVPTPPPPTTDPSGPKIEANRALGQSVTVATVTQQPIPLTMEASGTVVAADMLPILAKATGLQIQQVLVDEGDRVVAGQTLAILDQSVLDTQIAGAQADLEAAKARVSQKEAALAQTQARLAEANANLERYDNLSRQGAVSQQEFDTRATNAATAAEDVRVAAADIRSAQADVHSQDARLQQLQTQLGQTVVTAPANGIVAERFARVGNVTSNSDALFTIIRDRLLELDINIPETQLPSVQIGGNVTIYSDADPSLQLQGQVKEIAPLIDPATREAIVTVTLPASEKLRPGTFLKAVLTTGLTQGLTIPAAAVLPQSDNNAIVYRIVDNNQVQAQTVKLGDILDSGNRSNRNSGNPRGALIEIRQGLQVGDRVVVDGAAYLKDGDSVNVVAY